MKKGLCFIPLLAAVLSGILSFAARYAPQGTELEARRLSNSLEHKMDRLDRLAGKLLYEPENRMDWPELSGLPKDAVIYKYVCDSLHSWYNTLEINVEDVCMPERGPCLDHRECNISFLISSVGENPVFVNLGQEWYVMKSVSRGRVRLLEAIGVSSSSSSVSHISGDRNFRLVPLCEDDGEVVTLGSRPVFRVSENVLSSSSYTFSECFRWIFLACIAIFVICFLAGHRSIRNCCLATAAVFALASVSELPESLATLICFNLAAASGGLCVYICRENFKKPAVLFVIASSLACYILATYIYIVKYSDVELQLYKINSISFRTLYTYASYIFLLLSLMLVLESAVHHVRGGSMLTLQWIILFSTVSCAVLGFITSYMNVGKEVESLTSWSVTPFLERNVELEKGFRQIDAELADNPRIAELCFEKGGQNVLQRRVEEMLSGYKNNVVGIQILDDASEMDRMKADELSEGVPVSGDSLMIFSYYGDRPHYINFLKYSDSRRGDRILVVRVIQKDITYEILGLSPEYSYARYKDSRRMSSLGPFPYSSDIGNIRIEYKSGHGSVIKDGYIHFVTRADDRNVIVVSRPIKTALTYILYYIYLVLALFVVLMPFIRRSGGEKMHNSFSTMIHLLVTVSLVVTMLAMLFFSLYFVNRRNTRSQEHLMASRIRYVQEELQKNCSGMEDYAPMTEPDFARTVKNNLSGTEGEISIYTPQGDYLTLNERYAFDFPHRGRIASEAYKGLLFEYRQFCITEAPANSKYQYSLYAPVCNGQGRILAVVSIPYKQDDYEFTRDVVMHSASLIGLFIVLFLVTITMTFSITSAVFRPLSRLTRRMKKAELNSLEFLEYRGNDEISVLVGSYNEMVVALRRSNDLQMAMERDRAWSEMARQVAHEIKNPLTPIKLEIQHLMLLKERNDPQWGEKFESASAIILEHIEILANTANDFSTFAKLYTEPSVEMDLDEMIRDQIMLFKGKGEVKMEYSGMAGAVMSGPRPQLIRTVINLLTNACQAVEGVAAPCVRVSLCAGEAEGGKVWKITFEDNGPGVSDENVPKLFVPNFTTKSSGTGLGLAMCRNIVQKCGGSISYSRSETLGGACFTVVLPDGHSQM